ncbi:MAG: DUF177 domain-containing protein [Bacteroidetes bacterium]|nr:DUF177 domain-containing protein [Bacteroidota bacterium]
MDYLTQFIIPVTGLKPGSHQFDFEIDDSFFEHFEYSEIKNGLIQLHLVIEKEDNLLVFHFDFKGKVKVPCDRCYEMFDLAVEGKERLILKFGGAFHEESEDIQVVPFGENHFDVSSFIYEYIHLSLPVRRVHPENEQGESTCDPEVVSRLEDFQAEPGPDPRWDVLAQLKNAKKSKK